MPPKAARKAAVIPDTPKPADPHGNLDRLGADGSITGWCWSPGAPDSRRVVTVALNGVAVIDLPADLKRTDLRDAGVGDGGHGFSGRLPAAAIRAGESVVVTLLDAQTRRRICTPVSVTWPAQPAAKPQPRPSLPVAPPPAPPPAAAPSPAPARLSQQFSGNLDRVTRDGWVSGWCWDPPQPSLRVEVEILVGGAVVGRTLAGNFRADLQQAGVGDGAHGFAFALPYDVLAERGTLQVEARAGQNRIGEPVLIRLGRLAETEQRILDLERQLRLLRAQMEDTAARARAAPEGEARAARALFGQVAGFFQALADGAPEPGDFGLATVLDDLLARLPAIALARPATPLALLCIPATAPIETLHRCLVALHDSGSDRLAEIVLFDDGQADPRTALLPNLVTGLAYRRVAGRITAAVDAAIRAHAGPLVAIMAPQALAAEGWLESLAETLAHDTRAALASAVLLRGDGLVQHAGLSVGRGGSLHEPGQFADADLPEQRAMQRADAAAGLACVLVRERVLAAGGLDAGFASLTHAVVALSLRLRAAGGTVLVQPAAKLRWDDADSPTAPDSTGSDEDARRLRLAVLRALDDPAPAATAAGCVGRALVVDDAIPRPDNDAGSIATFEQMLVLRELGWQVSFMPVDGQAGPRGARARLERAGIAVVLPPHAPSVSEFLRAHGDTLDLVQIYRHHNAAVLLPQVREWAPQARLLFSPADLHFLREQRAATLAGRPPDAAVAQTRAQELACIEAADATIMVSDYEQALLAPEVSPGKLHLLRWIARTRPRAEKFEGRAGLLFIGSFAHPPNVDAVLWYAAEVAPLLAEQRPGIVLHVVGGNAPPALQAVAGPGIVLHGWVEDAAPLFDAVRLSVAPLRFGAGFKGKVATSLACGVPVVGTPTAFEGTGLTPGDGIVAAADAEALAEAIARLHDDAVGWEALSRRGQDCVAALYSPAAAVAVYAGLLKGLGLPSA